MSLVSVEHLTKSYGALKAVDDFSFSGDTGSIFALVGPDGAGKTSLFRTICGLLSFEAGAVTIGGFDLKTEFGSIKDILGYMPQNFSLYPDLSVEENLRFYAGLFGIAKTDFNSKRELLYEFSGLGPFRDRRAVNLSGGMKQKLALSCALIHDPKVLILDEPTTGVDPLSRRQFWEILKTLRGNGSCIVVSTPYMDEVELADRAAFVHRGKKLAEGNPEELTALYNGNVFKLEVEPTVDIIKKLGSIEGVAARRFGASIHLSAPAELTGDQLNELMASHGCAVARPVRIQPELEDVFIQLMSD